MIKHAEVLSLFIPGVVHAQRFVREVDYGTLYDMADILLSIAKYAGHARSCPSYRAVPLNFACTCGLDALQTKYNNITNRPQPTIAEEKLDNLYNDVSQLRNTLNSFINLMSDSFPEIVKLRGLGNRK